MIQYVRGYVDWVIYVGKALCVIQDGCDER
jgi:hypothetical protein